MVVVRVVVSVTEVLLRLCFRGWSVVVGAVSVGSDVAVLCWLFCSVVGLS